MSVAHLIALQWPFVRRRDCLRGCLTRHEGGLSSRRRATSPFPKWYAFRVHRIPRRQPLHLRRAMRGFGNSVLL